MDIHDDIVGANIRFNNFLLLARIQLQRRESAGKLCLKTRKRLVDIILGNAVAESVAGNSQDFRGFHLVGAKMLEAG